MSLAILLSWFLGLGATTHPEGIVHFFSRCVLVWVWGGVWWLGRQVPALKNPTS